MRPVKLCSKKLVPSSSPSVNKRGQNNQGSTVGRLQLKLYDYIKNLPRSTCSGPRWWWPAGFQTKEPHQGQTPELWSWAQTRFDTLPSPYSDTQAETQTAYFKFSFMFLCSCLSINISGSGSFSCLSRLTWSRSIWQQSGVKCCSVARVLLRIFRRLHCTASRAFCSASSLSPPPAASLDGVWGGRCVLGRGPGGNASPFLA